MDLKKFLPGKGIKDQEEFYWSLVIEPGFVQAGIWKIEDDVARVVYTSPENAWEVDEDLISACDAALSSAIQDFPEEIVEPQKTVFGVCYSWVTGGEISSEYLEKIKKICKDLSLTPVGFVVLPEAISHLIKSEEGTPLNGIVIGVYKENIEISIFELGKLKGTTQVARSVSLVDDSVEGLTRLNGTDTLPSRFLVYDGKEGDLEDARQSLLTANWEDYEKLKFLHTPKVELIDYKQKVNAVSLAGASELANVTKLGSAVTNPVEPITEEEKEFIKSPEPEGVSIEDLGFALEKDVQEDKKVEQEISENQTSEPDMSDISKVESNVSEVSDEEFLGETKKDEVKKEHSKLDIKNKLSGVFAFGSKIRFPKVKMSFIHKPLIFGLIFFILFIIAGLAWWWFYPKAEITIYVAPQKLEERIDLVVDVKRSGSAISEKVLKGSEIQTSVSGQKTKGTTGSKTVGDKAAGEITIYRVGPRLEVPAGTLVYGPGNLKFGFDNSVSVASGSASTPGVTKTKVTAVDIGAQYNLASNATFSIGNYSTSDMEGKNESSFSGGSSREINAVSKEDQEELIRDLEDELKNEAEGELKEKVEGSQFLLEGSQEVGDRENNFDHKVGDEASTLGLSMTVETKAVTVDKAELESLSMEVLKEKVPQGFSLRGDQITYDFNKGESENGEYKFELRISANLLPSIDSDVMKKEIAGKLPQLAQDYLTKEAPGFVRAEITIDPSLPGRLRTLPHVVKNIEIEVSAEK